MGKSVVERLVRIYDDPGLPIVDDIWRIAASRENE
jgi:hypothetical protein